MSDNINDANEVNNETNRLSDDSLGTYSRNTIIYHSEASLRQSSTTTSSSSGLNDGLYQSLSEMIETLATDNKFINSKLSSLDDELKAIIDHKDRYYKTMLQLQKENIEIKGLLMQNAKSLQNKINAMGDVKPNVEMPFTRKIKILSEMVDKVLDKRNLDDQTREYAITMRDILATI